MIKEKDFYSQFGSFTNKRLAKALCGITSIATILSAKGMFSKYSNKNRNLDNFFIYINSLHKNNIPVVKRYFSLGNKKVPVTLGFANQVEKHPDDFIENDNELFPVFILYRGYDHRASEYIFGKFGIEAHLEKDISAQDLYNKIASNECEYFLASIRSEFDDPDALITPSHLVIVQKTFTDKKKDKFVEYVDVSEKNYFKALKTISLEKFEKIFNKFGTLIK